MTDTTESTQTQQDRSQSQAQKAAPGSRSRKNVPADKPLSEKQKRACQEYIKDMNKVAAYRRAGYKSKTEAHERQEASSLFAQPNVKKYVEELLAEFSKDTDVTIQKVLAELSEIGFADIGKFLEPIYDDEGEGVVGYKITDLSKLDPGATKCISKLSFSTNKGRSSLRIELFDKMSALEKIGQYLGMFSDLNAAIATFRKYGYDVRQTDSGYEVIDLSTVTQLGALN